MLKRRVPFLIALILVSPALAQLDRGQITGVVADPSGAAIPQATVKIVNMANGAAYSTKSNDVGQYSMPNLPIGTYDVTFEAEGFKTLIRRGITVGITEVLRVDGKLEMGSVSESVEVTAEVPRLQTDTPEVGTSLAGRQLTDLPLTFSGARVAENFAVLISPGVAGNTYDTNINGSTNASKETLLEGATVSTRRAGHFSESSVSVEALQEFKVSTSGFPAEFRHAQGGVFNYVMKSGTNQVHGSAYGALRNEALNANSFANNARGAKRSMDRKQNYAGSFGGPVYIPKLYDGRNRTFFYVTYERYRDRSWGYGAPNRTVPLPEFYEGDLSRLLGPNTGQLDALGRSVPRGAIYDPATFRQLESGRWIGEMFPGNRIPVSRISQVSQQLNAISKRHYLPTVRDASGQFALVNNAIFPVSAQPETDQYNFSVKGDQVINQSHKLSGSYAYCLRPRLIAQPNGPQSMWDPSDPFGGPLSISRLQRIPTTFVRLAYDWTVSPSVLNHFMVYGNRFVVNQPNTHSEIDGAKELGIKGLTTTGYPAVSWGGGPFVVLAEPGDPSISYSGTTSWGVANSTSFAKGRHFMKAGFELRRNLAGTRGSPGGAFNFNARGTAIPNESFSGNQTGHAFASYLLGIVDSAGLADPIGKGARRTYIATYFQDDFRVNQRLTLQLGLRWELELPATEVADRFSSWNPNTIDPVSGLPGAYDFAGNCSGCTGKSYFGTRNWRNFGPRIGFAFQAAKGWTLRGAYGILYEGEAHTVDILSKATGVAWGGTYQLSADAVQPWRGIFNWDNGFPGDRFVPPSYDASWGNRSRPTMIDPDFGKWPYVQHFNFNVQRELKGLTLEIGYVGNKGTRMNDGQLRNLNQLPPEVLAKYGTRLNNPVRNEAEAAANGIRYPFPGFRGTVASALRPFPQVVGNQTVNVYGSLLGFSTYHSLQAVVNRQFRRGFTVYANYVWSKVLSNVQSSVEHLNPGRPLDYYNLKLEKSVAPFDIPHMFKAYMNYELPFGRNRALASGAGRIANTLIGGWAVSAIVNYYSGTPLGFGGSMPLSGGWNGATNRANIAAGNMKASGFSKSAFELSAPNSPNNTYLNKTLFSDPAPLTLGTSAFNYTQTRGFGTINEDVTLQKTQQISEKFRFQLRVELLNVFNRHRLTTIQTAITNPLFGQVTGVGGNRIVQVGMRLDF